MKAWKVALVNDESADQVVATASGTKRKAVSCQSSVPDRPFLSDGILPFRIPPWMKLNCEVNMITGHWAR
jgi:hypothetical protein